MASRFQSIRASALSNEKPKREREMSTTDVLVIIYLVMVIITAWIAWDHLGNPRFYRGVCSIIAGMFWPIPVGIFLLLWLESAITEIIDMFRK